MNKYYVTKTVAKLLQEHGFQLACEQAYDVSGNGNIILPSVLIEKKIPAPTIAEALDWFEWKRYNIWVQCTLGQKPMYYCKVWKTFKNNKEAEFMFLTDDYISRYQALNAAFEQILK